MTEFKRIICAVLALCMCVSLVACGKSGGEKEGQPAKTDGQAQEAAPEFMYASTFTRLDKEEGDNSSPLLLTDNGFYAMGFETVGEREHEGVQAEYEGQFDIVEPRISFFDLSGKKTLLSEYSPITEETGLEDRRDYTCNSYVSTLTLAEDGSLLALEQMNWAWSEAPEDISPNDASYFDYMKSENAYYLRRLDAVTGAELSTVKLELDTEEYIYPREFLEDGYGNVIVNSDMTVYGFAPDGTKSYAITPDSGYIYSMARLRDGTVGYVSYDLQDYGQIFVPIDGKTGTASEKSYKLPQEAYEPISGRGDYDLYYSNGSSFYGWNAETEKAEKLFGWTDCDVISGDMRYINVSDDGTVNGLSISYGKSGESDMSFVQINKVPAAEISAEILTMAVQYPGDTTLRAVVDFNRRHKDVRIVVKDYSEFNTPEDYSAGTTKLNTEILAGDVPDIMMVDSEMPYRRYAAKGVFADLYPYLEADGELSKEDFFPNLFSALEVDGKLYMACSGFGVISAAGSAEIVGDTPGWTYEDFYAALAKMPEGCDALDLGYDRNSLLTICLALELDNLVNWSTGECNFDSPEFMELLKFANQKGEDFDYENYEYSEEDSTSARIARGEQMLTQVSFYSLDYALFDVDMMFGGNATVVGFPTSEGVGHMLMPADSYAISATCKNKDAAWQFVRGFLTEEYQMESYYLPSNIHAFDELLKVAMKVDYEQDMNGNYILDENGEKIPLSKGSMFDGINTYEMYALTEKQAEQVRQVISEATRLLNYDQSINSIVTEGAAAYFAGQKTAEECAKLIQSKANIYVNEQR